MKKSLLLLVLISLGFSYAQEVAYYSPKVTDAVVYLNGATLTQSVTAEVKKGRNEIVLTDLASSIDERTIKVQVKGNAFVVAVDKLLNHIRKNKKSKAVRDLTDSLNFYESKRSELNAEIKVLQGKLSILSTLVQKGNKAYSISEIKKTIRFYSDLSGKFNYSIEKKKSEFQKVMEKIKSIKEQLKELNASSRKPVNEVRLSVESLKKGKIQISITYFTRAASWTPFYNLLSEGFGKPLILKMNAEIRQTTGLNWQGISLTVSTRNPYLNNNKPVLNPWFIDFRRSYPVQMYKAESAVSQRGAVMKAFPNEFVQEKTKGLAVEYKIKLHIPIALDGKGRMVEIKEDTLQGEYRYYAVPKMSKNGFLTCKIKNWEKGGYLKGEANIFYENSFVGKVFLNPNVSSGSLLISLGRDENITAVKKLVKDFKEESLIGSKVTRTFEYEIVLKNNKTKTIPLIVEDQIPISKDEKIEVELTEKSRAKFVAKTGKLIWNLKLKPQEKKILKLGFTVSYPGDKEISGL